MTPKEAARWAHHMGQARDEIFRIAGIINRSTGLNVCASDYGRSLRLIVQPTKDDWRAEYMFDADAWTLPLDWWDEGNFEKHMNHMRSIITTLNAYLERAASPKEATA